MCDAEVDGDHVYCRIKPTDQKVEGTKIRAHGDVVGRDVRVSVSEAKPREM